MEINAYSNLIDEMRIRLNGIGSGVIGFDGCMQSGKTTTAANMAKDIGAVQLSVDRFLLDNKQLSYLDRIDYKCLKSTIIDGISHKNIVIVEGVCLLDVLDRISQTLDLHIYIKRMSQLGTFGDMDYFDCTISEADMIAEIDKSEKIFSRTKEHSELDRDIVRYHKRRKPFEVATIIFHRLENYD